MRLGCLNLLWYPTATMGVDVSEILTPLLGALQASISVLLTISYGVIAAQFDLLNGDSAKQVSRLCVRMFLPALLITNVGSQLHYDTAVRYVPILSKYIKALIGQPGEKLIATSTVLADFATQYGPSSTISPPCCWASSQPARSSCPHG